MDEWAGVDAPRALPRVQWVWNELGLMRAQVQLEAHPYVLALREGSLSGDDLQILACEYDHIVAAVAVASRHVQACAAGELGAGLRALIDDADDDLARWRQFSVATGWGPSGGWHYAEDPFPETSSCADCLLGSGRSTTNAGVAGRLYMARILQGDLARAVTAGLEIRYGFTAPALAFFLRHESGNPCLPLLEEAVDHAATAKDPFAVLNAARETAQAHRRFYDSLEDSRTWLRASLGCRPRAGELMA